MKKTKEFILALVLVIICITCASIFIKSDMKIKYTFFLRKDNTITMLDSYGRKVLKEELNYAGKNNKGYYLIVNKDKKSAIIDEMGNFIINYDDYDNIEEYGSLYLAYKGEDIYLINRNNKLIRKVENTKELVSRIVNNYSVLLFDNTYYIYDSEGNVIKELKYKKKSKISLKETTNYGQVFYENKEYVFSLDTYEINEIETKEVSDMYEFNGVVLLKDEKNRIYVDGQLENDNIDCKKPEIDEFGTISCEDNIIYKKEENNDIKDKFKDYDELEVKHTNLNTYYIVKKGKLTTIYDENKTIKFQTKKDVKLESNYMKIDNKIYTFEGFRINL